MPNAGKASPNSRLQNIAEVNGVISEAAKCFRNVFLFLQLRQAKIDCYEEHCELEIYSEDYYTNEGKGAIKDLQSLSTYFTNSSLLNISGTATRQSGPKFTPHTVHAHTQTNPYSE